MTTTFGTLVWMVGAKKIWYNIDAHCSSTMWSILGVRSEWTNGLMLYILKVSCKCCYKQQFPLHRSMRVVSKLVIRSLSLSMPLEEIIMPESLLYLIFLLRCTLVLVCVREFPYRNGLISFHSNVARPTKTTVQVCQPLCTDRGYLSVMK